MENGMKTKKIKKVAKEVEDNVSMLNYHQQFEQLKRKPTKTVVYAVMSVIPKYVIETRYKLQIQ